MPSMQGIESKSLQRLWVVLHSFISKHSDDFYPLPLGLLAESGFELLMGYQDGCAMKEQAWALESDLGLNPIEITMKLRDLRQIVFIPSQGSRARTLEPHYYRFKSHFNLSSVVAFKSYLTSQYLSFLTCEKGIAIMSISEGCYRD
jgi:hypothetical protein